VLGLLGSTDLRDQARDLANTAPMTELREALQLAAGLPAWADGVCSAVGREICGQLGEVAGEWILGAFGLTRLLLAAAVRDRNGGPAGAATTARFLLRIRGVMRALRPLVRRQLQRARQPPRRSCLLGQLPH
jgi:hypothetical protein